MKNLYKKINNHKGDKIALLLYLLKEKEKEISENLTK